MRSRAGSAPGHQLPSSPGVVPRTPSDRRDDLERRGLSYVLHRLRQRGTGGIAGDCFRPSAEKEIFRDPVQRATNSHRLFVLTARRFIEYNRHMAAARKSKFKGKTVNVQPWFCDDCVRYGAVGLVAAAAGGSESPITDIRASHRALSPKCAGRHVTICGLEMLHLGD